MFLMRHNRGQSQRRDSSQVGIKPVKLGMAVISMGLSVVFCAKVTAAEPQPALAFDNIVVYERQGQNDVPYQIAENLGQPTVLYIWQDWCGACIKDLRQLNELAAEASVQVADLLVQTQPHAQLTKRRDQQT